MAAPPGYPSGKGKGKGNKKGGNPSGVIVPNTASSSSHKTKNISQNRVIHQMLSKAPGLKPYLQYVLLAAKAYNVDPVYVLAVMMVEDPSGARNARNASGAEGLGQILDAVIGNYNNQKLVGIGGTIYHRGQKITQAMKDSPTFSIAYIAWRISGGLKKGLGWPEAYSKGYHGGNPAQEQAAAAAIQSKIPGKYTPNSSPRAGVDPSSYLASTKNITATANNPFVVYNKKTHKISYSISLNNHVLMFDGAPVTRSMLQQQTIDKSGIGADYYQFTGRRPNPRVVAALMASGTPINQLENHWINDTKHFKNSPAGKKYQADYQDAWSQIMGKNSPIPWELVQEAAQANLSETEFAARLRMDGFKAQKQHADLSYMNSNEFNSKVDAYTSSYNHIYGQALTDPGVKHLAKDAALAGWDQTQWETYLRSLPQYTSTAEYAGHAMGILNQLGMSFGMLFGESPQGFIPKNPDQAQNIPAPPPDKRVTGTTTPGQNPNPEGTEVIGV